MSRSRTLKKKDSQVVLGNLVSEAAFAIVGRAGKFIPRLGIAFVDLIFDNDGNPFFLHLGGWDPEFFSASETPSKETQDTVVDFWDWDLQGDRRQVYSDFAANLLGYVSLLRRGLV
jgi:hypothetical protein